MNQATLSRGKISAISSLAFACAYSISLAPIIFSFHALSALGSQTVLLAAYAPIILSGFYNVIMERKFAHNLWILLALIFYLIFFSRIVWFDSVGRLQGRWTLNQIFFYQFIAISSFSAILFSPRLMNFKVILYYLVFLSVATQASFLFSFFQDIDWQRISLLFRTGNEQEALNANLYSSFGAASALVCMVSLKYSVAKTKERRRSTYLIFISSAIGSLGGVLILLLSASRTSMVGFILSMLIWIICRASKRYTSSVVGLMVFIVLLPIINFFSDLFNIRSIDTFRRILNITSGHDTAVLGRLKAYEESFEIISANPFFGFTNSVSGTTFVHNILLEVALISGLAGLGLFLIICGFAFFQATRCLRHAPIQFHFIALLFIFYFIDMQSSGSLYTSMSFFTLLFAVFALPRWLSADKQWKPSHKST